jgi:putative transposase
VLNRSNGRVRIFHDARDYRSLIDLLAEAQERIPAAVLAACIMPNHIHLVLKPATDDAITRLMHWLLTSHVRRHHRRYDSSGRLWQGRFKASVIQQDRHLLTVLRYVERNALTGKLVSRAEHWPWGSLNWRVRGQSPLLLAGSPVPLLANWPDYVNEPQSLQELADVRAAIDRERPIGSPEWTGITAAALGFEYSIRPRGRPRKRRDADSGD